MKPTWSVIVCSIDAGKFAQVCRCYEGLLAGRPFEIIGIHDAKSLCEGYNRGAARSRGDILVFSHDDVLIWDADFAGKVERRLAGGFDVLGFAGATRLADGYWWAAGPECLRGAVGHAAPKDPLLSLHVYGAAEAEVEPVAVLDGLCLIARREVLDKAAYDAETFDGFHLYDLDFTWTAHLQGLRLGAMSDTPIIHMSGGVFGTDWNRYRRRFLQKHAASLNLDIPTPLPSPRPTGARVALFPDVYALLQAWRPEILRRATVAMRRMHDGQSRPQPPAPQADLTGLAEEAQALSSQGRWSEAVQVWREIVRLDGENPNAQANLGLALAHAGQTGEAVDAYHAALRKGLPEDEVLTGVGIAFCLREQYGVAQENFENAVARNPSNLRAWSNLVLAYVRLGLMQKALEAAERVLALDPSDATTLSSLGTLCKDSGMPDQAIDWFRRAVEARPDGLIDRSNLMWVLLHSDTVSPGDIVAEGRRFDAHVLAQLPRPAPPRNAPVAAKSGKLRIGWLSGDLRDHAVGLFTIPVLEQFDRERFELAVYANTHAQDGMTLRAKAAAALWRDVADLGDEQLAEAIRRDQVDILVDLAGHTAGNRLAVFAHKPAPIQATWLGYPGTSGLSAMDYILAPPDPVLMAGGWCVETPIALPDCYCVRDPSQLPAVSPKSGGERPFTFGCLNNFAKASPSTVAAWASILNNVADSRLVLVALGGNDQELVADIQNRFGAFGIDSRRIVVRGRMTRADYYATYGEIDLGLDPFPFNGGTTGVDSLCMGTPFVTLEGQALHARMGANLLRPIGLHELIASTADDYVGKAVALASDGDALRSIRHGLRERVMASPLVDVRRFTRGLEKALRHC